MKRRIILLVLIIAALAGFGVLLHLGPSMIDAVTGATSKSEDAEEEPAELEGTYVFGMNPDMEGTSDSLLREGMKNIVSGTSESLAISSDSKLKLYVSETDEALLNYVPIVCERLEKAGIDVEVKEFSETMLRSRIMCGRYEMFLVSEEFLGTMDLNQTDFIMLDSKEMR